MMDHQARANAKSARAKPRRLESTVRWFVGPAWG